MTTGEFPAPRNRASDKKRTVRWSDTFLRWSFLWGPLLIAGVLAAIAYPAKVIAELRNSSNSKVEALAAEIRPEIVALKAEIKKGAEERDDLLEITSALLSNDCADTPARERIRRRIAKACEKIGAPSYVP